MTHESQRRRRSRPGVERDPLAILLFGALTEAGLAAARGDADADELFAASQRVIDRLAPSRSRASPPATAARQPR